MAENKDKEINKEKKEEVKSGKEKSEVKENVPEVKTDKVKDVAEKKDGEDKQGKNIERKNKKKFSVVDVKGLPISTKHSKAVCKFIKNKKIEDAIKDLEQVLRLKKSVPMKGEIAHRKGKGMMSGRFPRNASKNFIKLLKSLSANSIYNEIEDPIVSEAIANLGSRPYGRFGRVRMKRTHVKLIAKSGGKKK